MGDGARVREVTPGGRWGPRPGGITVVWSGASIRDGSGRWTAESFWKREHQAPYFLGITDLGAAHVSALLRLLVAART